MGPSAAPIKQSQQKPATPFEAYKTDVTMGEDQSLTSTGPPRNSTRILQVHPSFFDHSRTTTNPDGMLFLYLKIPPTSPAGYAAIGDRLDEYLTKPPVKQVRITCKQTNIHMFGDMRVENDNSETAVILRAGGEGILVQHVVQYLWRSLGKNDGLVTIETDVESGTFIEIADAVERR